MSWFGSAGEDERQTEMLREVYMGGWSEVRAGEPERYMAVLDVGQLVQETL